MRENLDCLPKGLVNVLFFVISVFILFGATPAISLSKIFLILLVFTGYFIIFFGYRRARVRYLEFFIFLVVAYFSFITFVNDFDMILMLRNCSFLLIFPLLAWVRTSSSIFASRINLLTILPYFQIAFILKLCLFEDPKLQGFRLYLNDYNVADSAVILLFCLGLISRRAIPILLSGVLFLFVLGFGIRLNAFVMLFFAIIWLFDSFKGRIVLFSGTALFFLIATVFDFTNLFIVSKFLSYGASYKVSEFVKLSQDLSFLQIIFPEGFSHKFELGVFGDGVYFSHFFILYFLTTGGLIGLLFVLYVFFLTCRSFFVILFTKSYLERYFLLGVLLSLVPSLTIQASYKSLTFMGLVYMVALIVHDRPFIRQREVC